jgi:MFS family permease
MNSSTVEHGPRLTIIVIGVMLASLLGRIDGTIVNVALPTIQGNLGATYDEVTWVIIGYLMANVVVIPLTPWLALRFGRRQAFVGAIAGFTVMSFFCATATSIELLVLYRILQGVFAAGVDSAANTVLTATFPPQKIGVAQSIFSLSAAAAPPIGLLLGGILTDNLSWQWCFLINVPIGAISAVLLAMMLRNPESPAAAKQARMDAIGLATLAVGPSLLVYFSHRRVHLVGVVRDGHADRGRENLQVSARRGRRGSLYRKCLRLPFIDGLLAAIRARRSRLHADAERPARIGTLAPDSTAGAGRRMACRLRTS